jgi:hypothetical protein
MGRTLAQNIGIVCGPSSLMNSYLEFSEAFRRERFVPMIVTDTSHWQKKGYREKQISLQENNP